MTVSWYGIRGGRWRFQSKYGFTTTERGTYGAESALLRRYRRAPDRSRTERHQRRLHPRWPWHMDQEAAWLCYTNGPYWIPWAIYAVPVPLAGADPGQVTVPDEMVHLMQVDPAFLAVVVEQAQLNPVGYLGEQGEVRPGSVICGTQRVTVTRPHCRPHPLLQVTARPTDLDSLKPEPKIGPQLGARQQPAAVCAVG